MKSFIKGCVLLIFTVAVIYCTYQIGYQEGQKSVRTSTVEKAMVG
jgi:hypothetical protein